MEHITIKELPNGLLSLTPYAGYVLLDRKSRQTFTYADIYPDDLPNWSAVAVADENGNENENEK